MSLHTAKATKGQIANSLQGSREAQADALLQRKEALPEHHSAQLKCQSILPQKMGS